MRGETVYLIWRCAGLTLPGLFGAVGTVAVAISFRNGVRLRGVKHRENSLSALPHSHADTCVCGWKGSLLRGGSAGDQVHCGAIKSEVRRGRGVKKAKSKKRDDEKTAQMRLNTFNPTS